MSITIGPNTGGTYPTALANNTVFYKYEPFSFTITSTAILTVSGTLVSYCSGSGSTSVVFASSGFATVGSASGETLTITPTGGTATTYTFFINAGRFVITPAIQGIVLYQNEPISNTLSTLGYSASIVSFQAQTLLCNIYTVPALPSSTLTLTGPVNTATTSTFSLGGTPGLLSATSNYYIVGSNTTNGYVATTIFPIQVSNERIWINSSSPATNSGSTFTLTSPIVLTLNVQLLGSPVFTSFCPVSALAGVTYTSNNFPPGVSLSNRSGSVTIIGTPTTSTATTYASTITATAFGLSRVTATLNLTFNYAPIIIFNPGVVNVYSNVAFSNQFSASVFPSNALVTFTSSGFPASFTLTPTGLLTGTTSVSTTGTVTAASAGLTPVTSNVTITASPVPISITASPSSLSGIVGQTPSTMTLTFSSGAYLPNFNFIAPGGVTCTGLPTPFVFSWTYPNLTATIVGTINSSTPLGPATFSVTVKSIDGATNTLAIPYSFSLDSGTITTVTSSPFQWTQNVAITPIQFSGTNVSGVPILYYFGTGAIPPGLFVSPGGILYGTPTTPASTQTFTGLSFTTGLSFSTIPIGSSYSYSVSADTVQLTSTVALPTLTPGSPVSVPLTTQTLSGVQPTGTLTTSAYAYGLTTTMPTTNPAAPAYVSGTLGSCVYPSGIVLPSSVTIPGTVSPNSIPAVIGLSNANPQTINRFIVGEGSTGGYTVYCDYGTMTTFSPVYTQPFSPLPGPHGFQIISNATTSLAKWSGALMIVDGTANTIVSTNLGTFSQVAPGGTITYSIYYSSWWIAHNDAGNLLFSQSPAATWTVATPSGSSLAPSQSAGLGTAVSGYVLCGFMSYLLLGGGANINNKALFWTAVTSLPLASGFTFTATDCSLTNVYSIAASSTVAVAGGTSSTLAPAMQYSTNGISWINITITNGQPTLTSVTSVVYGGSAVNAWMALGPNGVAWSADGKTWTQLPLTLSGGLGPIQFDGLYWSFFLTSGGVFTMYYHDALSSTILTPSSWKSVTVNFASPPSALYLYPTPIYTLSGSPQVTLYAGTTPTGPTFTSIPTTYAIYQYIPITPITFSATNSPTYFLGSTLPPGMTWNGSTISGLSVKLGTFAVTVYAQSTIGTSSQTITFIVSRAPILQNITSAAEYTSFVREKVTADASTSSINSHITPFKVGSFLLERPPAIITAPEICCETTQSVKRIIN